MLKDISEQVGFPKAKPKDTESIVCGTPASALVCGTSAVTKSIFPELKGFFFFLKELFQEAI